ncbi:CHAT domain-containing protein [Actinoplanes sp. NPDC051513]|uniref:CHAT domain-containing protein n=1 Tax=Actinoplanes sp. NPDC051513 TaxID=3363908 RepID=UPI0037AF1AC4
MTAPAGAAAATWRTPTDMSEALFTDPLALVPGMDGRSAAELDRLIAELARPELRPTPAFDLVRAQALGARFVHDRRPGTLAEALATYDSCAYRGLARGTVGRSLVLRLLHAGLLGQPFDTVRVRALIDDAGDDPAMPGTAAVLHAMTDALAAYGDDPGYDRAQALRRLDDLAEAVPPESPLADVAPAMRAALAVKRGSEHGVYADAAAAAEHARSMLARDDLDERRRLLAEAMAAAADGLADAQHGNLEGAMATAQALTDVVDRMPAGDPAAEAMRRLLAGATGTARPEGASEADLAAGERAWRLLLAALPVARTALDLKSAAELARGVRMLREAADAAPPGYSHAPLIGVMLGGLLCTQYQLGAGRPALDEALRRLRTAQRESGHPGHPMWAPSAMSLALADRLDGRLAASRETGLRALRGHAWSVLLQAGAEDAAAAARHAADEAKQVARWCLADAEPAVAARALDAGRCLMLYAATVTMDVPARLRGLGRTDLLGRWQRDHTDADLRAEVLAVLIGAPLAEDALPDMLDPPTPREVGTALAEVRADVLVYLAARDDQGAGYAVLVPAEGRAAGRVSHLTLPGLAATGRVARHLQVLGSRDAGAAEGGAAEGGEPPADLDGLCDWAWTAAIGPLLGTLDRWRIGRAPRIVMVPMGELAAVPWHAARDRDGTRAVELATFSYAASARLLCLTAERAPVAADAPALVVGDPTGDLPEALAEAGAIREAFYPAAEMLQGAAATPEEVRAWFLAGGGAVLHLACHGAVQSGVDGSHLRLSGGRLTARDILQTRRQSAIGLVALAACTTGTPSGAYDEASSLTTAFLAAGARSVFGSLWPVPDGATSLLMFMAHHYLRAGGKRPVDALNHAQRWMLDPDREIPPTMPPALAARVPLVTADVTAWAGFTHQGR